MSWVRSRQRRRLAATRCGRQLLWYWGAVRALMTQSALGRDWQPSTRLRPRSRSESPGASGQLESTAPSTSSTLQVPQEPTLHS